MDWFCVFRMSVEERFRIVRSVGEEYMIPGLLKGQVKMSKCNPSFAFFMEDEEDEVNSKINNTYCPPNVVGGNACLEYLKYIVFPWFNEFKVESKAENRGEK
ncbi:hypothetical protein L1987_20982 [Smallanthus sonchifolius]|uniref:Uncharacterized protein n=1 Tax=Smallanthus sonchifolius TaxID=185202 RepID=A0ACB9IUT1_9ASTR|nr:hypothetical protein L1987_20982 [Smallanthus sonchifolius]